MNHLDRQETISSILHECISAIIRTKDQGLAADAMEAAVAGGFRVVEFTMTTPGALELVTSFSKRPGLMVGAGTVMTPAMVREAAVAGARFVVSPVCDPEVLAEAARLGLATIPGAFTPTEMQQAYRSGADFVKVFPAPPGGPDYIQAIVGPLPHLRLFPTAGVDADNFTRWLDAGCVGAGFVRSLFEPQDLNDRAFHRIRERAALIHGRLASWRSRVH